MRNNIVLLQKLKNLVKGGVMEFFTILQRVCSSFPVEGYSLTVFSWTPCAGISGFVPLCVVTFVLVFLSLLVSFVPKLFFVYVRSFYGQAEACSVLTVETA
jgi:hypothetical protein